MSTKVNKLVKLVATGLFLMALAINVKVTLDDPFTMVTDQALATDSDSCTGTGSGSSGFAPFWNPTDLPIVCGGIQWEKTVYYGASGTIVGTLYIYGAEVISSYSGSYSTTVVSCGVSGVVTRTGRDCPGGL